MLNYDKEKIKQALTLQNHFELLQDFGADPIYTNFGIIARTVCHNPMGEGSQKLYFYENSQLYNCYTGCGSFDIFQLVIKVAKIQWGKEYDLNNAVRYVAIRFGLAGEQIEDDDDSLIDWKTFNSYDRVQAIEVKDYHVKLKEYDPIILSRLNYTVKILPWLKEGISQQAIEKAQIGYAPASAQITIPHFDKDGNFIGLRGRFLCEPDIEAYGKYRPMILAGQQYNHPLGMNLYNLNNSKDNIKAMGKAIILEGEKSTLKFQSYFGFENDITVACCGSNVSAYQIQLLLDYGAKEIIIALDRQFQEIGDPEFKHLTDNLTKLNERYKNYVDISFIFDKKMITNYKDAPVDQGAEIFLKLWKDRIKL